MIPGSLNTMLMGSGSSFEFFSDLFPAPTSAYSLFKLNKAYTGACLEVRQWNGSNLVDPAQIGFDSNNFVDVAAIAAWQATWGGATPYVTMLYDQFGTNDCNQRGGGTNTANVNPSNLANGRQALLFDGNDVLSFTTDFAMPSTFDWFVLTENTNKTANAGYGLMISNRNVTSGAACSALPTFLGQSQLIGASSYNIVTDDYKDYALYNFSDTSGTSKVIRRDGVVLASTNTALGSTGKISGFGRYRGTGTAYATALSQGAVLYNNGDAASVRNSISAYLMNLAGV